MREYKAMTEEEMIARIKELEDENNRLKKVKIGSNVASLMKNKTEVDFLAPYYDERNGLWRASTVKDNFTYLRQLAVSVVDAVGKNNKFTKQRIPDMKQEDLLLVVECADELALVAAKYKKRYLESLGRTDIVKAFDM